MHNNTPPSNSTANTQPEGDFLRESLQAFGGIVVIDEGKVKEASEHLCSMFGYTQEEVIGKSISDFVVPEDHAELVENIRQQKEVCEYHGLRKDGSIFPIEVQAKGIPYQNRTVRLSFVSDLSKRQHAQDALRASEQRYRLLFNIGPDAAFVHEAPCNGSVPALPGRFLDVNEVACRRLGYTREEMLQMSPPEIDAPESLPGLPAIMGKLAEDKFAVWEGAHIAKDGRRIPIEITNRLFEFQGKPVILSTARDITERKRAQEAWRESEERYRLLFNSGNDAILVHGFTREGLPGVFLQVNDVACRRLGYRREELLALRPQDIDAPEHANRIPSMIELLATQNYALFESEHVTKEGRRIPVEINSRLCLLNGQLIAIAIARDISSRNEAQEALRLSEERFRRIFESGPVGMAIVGLDFHFIKANPALCKMLDYSEQELCSTTFKDVTHSEDLAQSLKIVGELIHGEVSSVRLEKRYVRKDKSAIWGSTALSVIRDNKGNVLNFIAIIEDISERKRAEQLRAQLEAQARQSQKIEAFGQLAGGVAHDFNNVLTVIQSHASLLQAPDYPKAKQAESIKEIARSAERAGNLTRQLLTFSRRQLIQTVDSDLNEICANMGKMLQRLIGEHISFEASYTTAAAIIHADQGMMEQVLLNLVVNSRDAMPKGGRLLITTETVDLDEAFASQSPRARPGSFVKLSVSDTGLGIAPENLPRIFEPFFTTKEVGKGTGLGLATVFGIVEQHKGWIEVQSRLGTGTAVHVYLPRLQKIAQIKSEQPLAPVMSGGNETILLVEDEPAVRLLVRHVLEHVGYRVHQAADGHEALKIWEQQRSSIRLLLTDMIMPGNINGRELAECLLKQDANLKVLYCSGYSQEILGKDFTLEGGVNFLQKPYTPAKLLRLVRNCLDGRTE